MAAPPPRPSHSAIHGASAVEQRWDPARYQQNAGFVAVLGAPLLDLLAPLAGERILDLGCGDGALTLKIAETASVLGVDFSADQIRGARARGLDARVADGNRLDFNDEFDAVFSNAALHWMRDPDGVIAGVWRALKPGGRFVAECGGAGNVASIMAALVAALDRRGIDGKAAVPWYFPAPEEYRARLERRGFQVESIALIPRLGRPVYIDGTRNRVAEIISAEYRPSDQLHFYLDTMFAKAPEIALFEWSGGSAYC